MFFSKPSSSPSSSTSIQPHKTRRRRKPLETVVNYPGKSVVCVDLTHEESKMRPLNPIRKCNIKECVDGCGCGYEVENDPPDMYRKRLLQKYATNLNDTPFDKKPLDYVFLAIIASADLGNTPMMNSIELLRLASCFGYECFFLLNTSSHRLTLALRNIFRRTNKHLILFMNCHGLYHDEDGYTHLSLISGENQKECISSYFLRSYLKMFRKEGCVFTGIIDCCNCDDLFQFNSKKTPKNCLSLSSCDVNSYSYFSRYINRSYFIQALLEVFEEDECVIDLLDEVKKDWLLKSKKQTPLLSYTNEELIYKPLFYVH